MDTTIAVPDWGNLSATACLIGLVVWSVTRGLPSVMSKWAAEAAMARTDFVHVTESALQESAKARADFREESAQHRTDALTESQACRASFERVVNDQRLQSRELAKSGQDAVNSISEEFRKLRQQNEQAAKAWPATPGTAG